MLSHLTTHKDQLSLANPSDALPHGEYAANKWGGRSVWYACDRSKL